MKEFKLKIVLSVLGGVIFSFIFILLALVLPTQKEKVVIKKAKNKLEAVSHTFKGR